MLTLILTLVFEKTQTHFFPYFILHTTEQGCEKWAAAMQPTLTLLRK